MELKTVSSRT